MPVVVALAIRSLIQMSVTLGIIGLADKFLLPLINAAIAAIMRVFGLSEDEAKDVMANEVLIFAEQVLIGVITLRAKIPTKIAERLGFTSKGWTKRTLTKKAKDATAAETGKIANTGKATLVESNEIAGIVAPVRGISLPSARTLLGIIATAVGVPTAFFFMVAQYIDFANWQGPYQGTFQKLLGKIGLNPDTPMPKARVVSKDVWDRIAATIEELSPLGLAFPVSGIDKPYTRANLADLVDEIAANLVKAGGQASYKNVIGLVLPLVQLSGVPAGTSSSTSPAKDLSTTSPASSVKVFTGIVSNGVLGKGLEFTPRPDDIIDSMSDLQSAIDNNLAPFLVALPRKIIYEIKVVSSIIDADGLKQYGKTQTIQTGTDTLGKPKFKTLINKWAVLYLYVLTDKGSRTKIASIVLGPTDAVKFRPDTSSLAAISRVIPTSAITLNTAGIVSVVPNDPKPITPDNFARAIGVPEERIDQKTGEIIDPTDAEVEAYKYQFQNAPPPAAAATSTPSTARTLFEWYAAKGLKLPSINDRGQLYQSLGLGQASLYVGSAEQNTRLLNKLKEAPPPPPPVAIAKPAPPVIQNTQAPAPTGFFRPNAGTPIFDRSSGASLGLADGKTDYNTALVRT